MAKYLVSSSLKSKNECLTNDLLVAGGLPPAYDCLCVKVLVEMVREGFNNFD
jgi:hypothetical protein